MIVRVAWMGWVALVLLVTWAVWLFLLWQPARQIELHTLNLLERGSSRDWPAVETMMAPDYRDAWNGDRTAAIDEARRLFSHFFALQIVPLETLRIAGTADERSATAPVGIFGSGTAIAHEIMDEVRDVKGPFEFRWRKSAAWPWQWALVEVRHEELEGRWGR